uniref:Uncharacterized protein n=1 Tax=Cucumis melo TaxID=3656 RepID=A0A9I9E3U8_CUCME
MLQPKRFLSQVYCSRESRRLIYIAAEEVVPSNMLQLRRLSFLNMLQLRRSSSQICYNREDRR